MGHPEIAGEEDSRQCQGPEAGVCLVCRRTGRRQRDKNNRRG